MKRHWSVMVAIFIGLVNVVGYANDNDHADRKIPIADSVQPKSITVDGKARTVMVATNGLQHFLLLGAFVRDFEVDGRRLTVTIADILNDRTSLEEIIHATSAGSPQHVQHVDLNDVSVTLIATDWNDHGRDVVIGKVPFPRAIGRGLNKLVFMVEDERKHYLDNPDDLRIVIAGRYRARYTEDLARAYGNAANDAIASVVSSLASRAELEATTMIVPLSGGELDQRSAWETSIRRHVNVAIEKRADRRVDESILAELVVRMLGTVFQRVQLDDDVTIQRVAFVLEDGVKVEVAVDKFANIEEDTTSDLSRAIRDFRSTGKSTSMGGGVSVAGFGVNASGANTHSETNAHDRSSRDAEAIRRAISGDISRLKGMRASDIRKALQSTNFELNASLGNSWLSSAYIEMTLPLQETRIGIQRAVEAALPIRPADEIVGLFYEVAIELPPRGSRGHRFVDVKIERRGDYVILERPGRAPVRISTVDGESFQASSGEKFELIGRDLVSESGVLRRWSPPSSYKKSDGSLVHVRLDFGNQGQISIIVEDQSGTFIATPEWSGGTAYWSFLDQPGAPPQFVLLTHRFSFTKGRGEWTWRP